MLDLTQMPSIPAFELKVAEDDVREFDALALFYAFKDLEGVEDPLTVRNRVNTVFEIDVSSLVAVQVLQALTKFVMAHGETLKNVLGALPSFNATIQESDTPSINASESMSSPPSSD